MTVKNIAGAKTTGSPQNMACGELSFGGHLEDKTFG